MSRSLTEISKAPVVDISSGVEKKEKVKCENKVKNFIKFIKIMKI